MAFVIVLAVVTISPELLPLAAWLMWGSRRTWAWSSALAWTAVLAFIPFVLHFRSPAPPTPRSPTPMEAATQGAEPSAEGLVYVDRIFNVATGDVDTCGWSYPWRTTVATQGRIRPLFGLYRETSSSSEFLSAELSLRSGAIDESGLSRPHWYNAWKDEGSPSLDTPLLADALGARWYAECGPDDSITVTELSGNSCLGSGGYPPHESRDVAPSGCRVVGGIRPR